MPKVASGQRDRQGRLEPSNPRHGEPVAPDKGLPQGLVGRDHKNPTDAPPTGYPENGGSSLLSTHWVIHEGDKERAVPAHAAYSSDCKILGARWATQLRAILARPLPGLDEPGCRQGLQALHVRTGTRSFHLPSCGSFGDLGGF